MAEVPYDQFLPKVQPYVFSCNELMALDAIKDACQEFCTRSQFLRLTLDNIPLEVGTGTYYLPLPSNYCTAGIVQANVGSTPIVAKSDAALQQMFGYNWQLQEGSISYYTQEDQFTIRVVQIPVSVSADAPLKLTVALTPLPVAESIDQRIFDLWAEVIAMGARARLHDIPKQAFSDRDAAQRFRKWFDSRTSDAKISVDRGYGQAVLRVRPLYV